MKNKYDKETAHFQDKIIVPSIFIYHVDFWASIEIEGRGGHKCKI